MSSIKLCLAICKMFSECKIFSVENILRNGKHFLLVDCVVKITSENYFSHLVLDVKNLFSKNVNPSQPPPPWTSTTHLHPHNIQIGKREKTATTTLLPSPPTENPPPSTQNPPPPTKTPPPMPHKNHQNTTTHTTTTTTKSEIKENEN